MKKFIKKFKSTHFDVAAGPMILIFGGIAVVFGAIAVTLIVVAIKLIIKAKNEYQSTDTTNEIGTKEESND